MARDIEMANQAESLTARADELEASQVPAEVLAFVADLDKALAARGSSLTEFAAQLGGIRRLAHSEWEQAAKLRQEDGTDEITVTPLSKVSWTLDLGPLEPEWPPVQPAPPIKLPAVRKPKDAARDTAAAVCLPDMQIGFWRTPDGSLCPTHDPAAIDVATRLVKLVAPDRVVFHGDNLDFPELSDKFVTSAAFADTTQAAINEAAVVVARIRAAAPVAQIDWIEGNHEARLARYIERNARVAMGLRNAGDPPASWPVLSVPRLCGLDDLGVSYHAGYPAAHVWLSPRLRVIHGHKALKGSTGHGYLNDGQLTSVLYGHIHRRELAERTMITPDGPLTVTAASAGTLARVDGAVPSGHQGLDHQGQPVATAENWQQGVAVVHHDDGWHSIDLVPIHRTDTGAFAVYQNRKIEGEQGA